MHFIVLKPPLGNCFKELIRQKWFVTVSSSWICRNHLAQSKQLDRSCMLGTGYDTLIYSNCLPLHCVKQ